MLGVVACPDRSLNQKIYLIQPAPNETERAEMNPCSGHDERSGARLSRVEK